MLISDGLYLFELKFFICKVELIPYRAVVAILDHRVYSHSTIVKWKMLLFS